MQYITEACSSLPRTEHVGAGWGDEMVTPAVKQLYFSNVMWFAFDLRMICPAKRVGAEKAEEQHSRLVLSLYSLLL